MEWKYKASLWIYSLKLVSGDVHTFLGCTADSLNGSASIKAQTSKVTYPHQLTNTYASECHRKSLWKNRPIRESCSMIDTHNDGEANKKPK
jgi:hypothetical protein